MTKGTRLVPINRTTIHACVDSGATRNEVSIQHQTQSVWQGGDHQFQEQTNHAQVSGQQQTQSEPAGVTRVEFWPHHVAIETHRVACCHLNSQSTQYII